MTSSARSRIDCGTVRPSALAVLRFTAISYFTGNCTGRSPAFAPRRMRSTKVAARRKLSTWSGPGEQAAVSDKVRCDIDRRYVVSGRRKYDRHAMRDHEWIRRDDKAASRLAPKGDDGRFNLYVVMNGRSDCLDLE